MGGINCAHQRLDGESVFVQYAIFMEEGAACSIDCT
jgi:hypothetical protein